MKLSLINVLLAKLFITDGRHAKYSRQIEFSHKYSPSFIIGYLSSASSNILNPKSDNKLSAVFFDLKVSTKKKDNQHDVSKKKNIFRENNKIGFWKGAASENGYSYSDAFYKI